MFSNHFACPAARLLFLRLADRRELLEQRLGGHVGRPLLGALGRLDELDDLVAARRLDADLLAEPGNVPLKVVDLCRAPEREVLVHARVRRVINAEDGRGEHAKQPVGQAQDVRERPDGRRQEGKGADLLALEDGQGLPLAQRDALAVEASAHLPAERKAGKSVHGIVEVYDELAVKDGRHVRVENGVDPGRHERGVDGRRGRHGRQKAIARRGWEKEGSGTDTRGATAYLGESGPSRCASPR